MRLLIIPIGDDYRAIENEIIELETNSQDRISKTLYSIMKGKRYSVEIYKNLNDFLVLHFDSKGGIAFYLENKQEHKYDLDEHSYDKAIEFINIYINPDGSENLKQIFIDNYEKVKRLEKQRFDKWKVKYQHEQKKEKKNNLIKYSLFFIILGIISFIFYLVYVDELKFIGRNTITKKGVITKTNFDHIGSGFYMQTVKYKFLYSGNTYSNSFEAGKLLGKQYVGDSVLIKFRVSDPNVCKYIKTVYE